MNVTANDRHRCFGYARSAAADAVSGIGGTAAVQVSTDNARAPFNRCRSGAGHSTVRGNPRAQRGAWTRALSDLADFPFRRYPHDWLLLRVWELRNNVTAYDAVYVALAEALDAPLLTSDRHLAAAAGHHARVELV